MREQVSTHHHQELRETKNTEVREQVHTHHLQHVVIRLHSEDTLDLREHFSCYIVLAVL